jgi:putative nucleotidyltransferase with HDIG domain
MQVNPNGKDINEEQLHISAIEPGMVLSRNVYDESGQKIFGKGLRLTAFVCRRMIEIGIRTVFIVKGAQKEDPNARQEPQVHAELPVTSDPKFNPISETEEYRIAKITASPEFARFEAKYEENSEQIKQDLLNISNGGQIDLHYLYHFTSDIMDNLENKGDIFVFLNNLRIKDEYTFTHCTNVALIANIFGSWLNLRPYDLIMLTSASLLHDVGKLLVPDSILNKKGPLTTEEFDVIKRHTINGYAIVKDHDLPPMVKQVVLQHHEKTDGSGYPLRLSGDQIEPYARIVTICDIYDAMTANRVYRPKICPFEVIADFEESGSGKLDDYYLKVFLNRLAENYIGSEVMLSDGRKGEIMFVGEPYSRPTVRIHNKVVNLKKEPELSITEFVG